MIKDEIGLVHLIMALLALLSGTIVLFKRKATRSHKRVGYIYCFSMSITILTALLIYRVYGKWGVFHYMALVSGLTLLLGMLPLVIKSTKKTLDQHFRFMFWSVGGLYCAFAAEMIVRVPKLREFFADVLPHNFFHYCVFGTTGIVIIIAAIFFRRMKPQWNNFVEKYSRLKN